ncbi:MAG: DUF1292 domain-containing protein [Lachnospiraceae bacterium]|nr:DUF1292 domain-containing protein [Lachnospiraceae bacterium]
MAENENLNSEEEMDLGIITLTLDDNTELDCAILAIFPVDDKDYIALLPLGEEEDDDEVLIYRFIDKGDDADPELENIDDDDEYDAAADAFDEILDEMEFDEDEDDEEEKED